MNVNGKNPGRKKFKIKTEFISFTKETNQRKNRKIKTCLKINQDENNGNCEKNVEMENKRQLSIIQIGEQEYLYKTGMSSYLQNKNNRNDAKIKNWAKLAQSKGGKHEK